MYIFVNGSYDVAADMSALHESTCTFEYISITCRSYLNRIVEVNIFVSKSKLCIQATEVVNLESAAVQDNHSSCSNLIMTYHAMNVINLYTCWEVKQL